MVQGPLRTPRECHRTVGGTGRASRVVAGRGRPWRSELIVCRKSDRSSRSCLDLTHGSRRVTGHCRILWYVLDYDGTRCDDAARADANAAHDYAVHANPGTALDCNRSRRNTWFTALSGENSAIVPCALTSVDRM